MKSRIIAIAVLWCYSAIAPLQAADVVLNEYNAVSRSNTLDDGDGQDSYFGTIEGNGGNWFELLVVGDHVDMRGWQLEWTEDEQIPNGDDAAGTISLSNDLLWSDLRSGSLITFIETPNAEEVGDFNTSTDVSYDPFSDDWWINVSTQQEMELGGAGLVATITNDGETPGDFSVGKDDWLLTILDSNNATVFGPVGEGASWSGSGVGSSDGGSLEGPLTDNGSPPTVAMYQAITPSSEFYDDTGSTSFGAPNVDYDTAAMQFVTIQDLSALRAQVMPPLGGDGDFDGDGALTAADIDALTAAVRAQMVDAKYDLNVDGLVDDQDRIVWVEQLKRTYIGDSNLDGEFSSSDLVVVLAAGQYEDDVDGNSTWATGDWNGDGDFSTSDLVAAFNGGGYERGKRAATVATVPEPSSLSLLSISLLGLLARRRRDRRCDVAPISH